jgi:glutamine transport system substrate-binding protein
LKKTLVWLLATCLVVLSIGLAGCAQTETPDPSGTPDPSTGTNDPTPKVKLIAVGEATFAPFEYMDPDTEELAGFDVDLIKAIAEASGFEVEYKNIGWNSLVPSLQNEEADLIVSGMTITDERLLAVAFSDPYFTSGQAWAVKEGSLIKTLDDLAGKTVAVQINTTGFFAAEKLDAKFKDEGKSGLTIKNLSNAADVFIELKTGGCDAVISDLPVIQEYLKNNPDDKVIIPEPAFTVEYYGIAMRKADSDIHELINKGLAKIKFDGTYDTIYEKYFGAK